MKVCDANVEALYSRPAALLSPEDTLSQQNQADNESRPYLSRVLNPSEAKEVDNEFKKTVYLGKQRNNRKNKNAQPPRLSRKPLSSREKKRLHLNLIPKKSFRFSELSELNDLWTSYITELVDLAKVASGDESTKMRLCRADLHGALIKVSKARAAGHVGLEGYVVQETRNTFRLVCRDNVVKTVPKMGSSFTTSVNGHRITFGGSTMCMKPAERAVKKWKLRMPFDL